MKANGLRNHGKVKSNLGHVRPHSERFEEQASFNASPVGGADLRVTLESNGLTPSLRGFGDRFHQAASISSGLSVSDSGLCAIAGSVQRQPRIDAAFSNGQSDNVARRIKVHGARTVPWGANHQVGIAAAIERPRQRRCKAPKPAGRPSRQSSSRWLARRDRTGQQMPGQLGLRGDASRCVISCGHPVQPHNSTPDGAGSPPPAGFNIVGDEAFTEGRRPKSGQVRHAGRAFDKIEASHSASGRPHQPGRELPLQLSGVFRTQVGQEAVKLHILCGIPLFQVIGSKPSDIAVTPHQQRFGCSIQRRRGQIGAVENPAEAQQQIWDAECTPMPATLPAIRTRALGSHTSTLSSLAGRPLPKVEATDKPKLPIFHACSRRPEARFSPQLPASRLQAKKPPRPFEDVEKELSELSASRMPQTTAPSCKRLVRSALPVSLDPTVSSDVITETNVASVPDCAEREAALWQSFLRAPPPANSSSSSTMRRSRSPGPTASHVTRVLGSEAGESVWTVANLEQLIQRGPTGSMSCSRVSNSSTGSSGSVQHLQIGLTGCYRIEAAGARGGSKLSKGTVGGHGATAAANFSLTAGIRLDIAVGQAGSNESVNGAAPGGGGGSFVWTSDGSETRLLLAAGGGGGGATGGKGLPGEAGRNGSDTIGTHSRLSGLGGTNGAPGSNTPRDAASNCNHGGCGAGWLGKAVNPRRGNTDGERGGSVADGWVGGSGGDGGGGNGGFGGGGGGGGSASGTRGAPGAGGGFSGGGAGLGFGHAGGGGGSACIGGSGCVTVTGGNADNEQGRVAVRLLDASSSIPKPGAATLVHERTVQRRRFDASVAAAAASHRLPERQHPLNRIVLVLDVNAASLPDNVVFHSCGHHNTVSLGISTGALHLLAAPGFKAEFFAAFFVTIQNGVDCGACHPNLSEVLSNGMVALSGVLSFVLYDQASALLFTFKSRGLLVAMCRWGCSLVDTTYMCKWCGTRFCKECLLGDFYGRMKEPGQCRVCNQKRCQGKRVEFVTKPRDPADEAASGRGSGRRGVGGASAKSSKSAKSAGSKKKKSSSAGGGKKKKSAGKKKRGKKLLIAVLALPLVAVSGGSQLPQSTHAMLSHLPERNMTRPEVIHLLNELKKYVKVMEQDEYRRFSELVFTLRSKLFETFNQAFEGIKMSDYNVLCHFRVYPSLIFGSNYPTVQELTITLMDFVIESLRGGDTKPFLFVYVRLYLQLGQPYVTYSNLLRHSGDRTAETLYTFAKSCLPEVDVPPDCRKTLLMQLSDPRLLLRPRCELEDLARGNPNSQSSSQHHDSMTSVLQYKLLSHVARSGNFDYYNTTHRIIEFIELIIFGHFDALRIPNRMWINPTFKASLPGKLSAVAQLIRYGYPILLLIGTVSNLIALLFSLVNLSESISCMYFLALSVLDLLCLWCNLLPILLSLYFDIFAQEASQLTCKLIPFFGIFTAGSVAWLVVALTYTKLATLVRPFWHSLYSRRVHRLLILGLIVLVAAMCSPLLFTRYRLVVLDSDFFIQCWRYESTVFSYGLEKMWLALVFPVIPLLLVLAGNCALIALRTRHLRQLSRGSGYCVDDKSFGSLVGVSCVFLAFTAPNTVVQMIEAFRSQNINYYDVTDELNNGNGTLFNYWIHVTHFVMLLHNAVNIFTYGMSAPYLRKSFRLRLARLVGGPRLLLAATSSSTSRSSSLRREDTYGSALSVKSGTSSLSAPCSNSYPVIWMANAECANQSFSGLCVQMPPAAAEAVENSPLGLLSRLRAGGLVFAENPGQLAAQQVAVDAILVGVGQQLLRLPGSGGGWDAFTTTEICGCKQLSGAQNLFGIGHVREQVLSSQVVPADVTDEADNLAWKRLRLDIPYQLIPMGYPQHIYPYPRTNPNPPTRQLSETGRNALYIVVVFVRIFASRRGRATAIGQPDGRSKVVRFEPGHRAGESAGNGEWQAETGGHQIRLWYEEEVLPASQHLQGGEAVLTTTRMSSGLNTGLGCSSAHRRIASAMCLSFNDNDNLIDCCESTSILDVVGVSRIKAGQVSPPKASLPLKCQRTGTRPVLRKDTPVSKLISYSFVAPRAVNYYQVTSGSISLNSSVTSQLLADTTEDSDGSCARPGHGVRVWKADDFNEKRRKGTVVKYMYFYKSGSGRTDTVQYLTVAEAGCYRIDAFGARGGFDFDATKQPGRGASVSGSFSLTADTQLAIVVAQAGGNSAAEQAGSGGGGGSFVYRSGDSQPLLAAGIAGSSDTKGADTNYPASTDDIGAGRTDGGPGKVPTTRYTVQFRFFITDCYTYGKGGPGAGDGGFGGGGGGANGGNFGRDFGASGGGGGYSIWQRLRHRCWRISSTRAAVSSGVENSVSTFEQGTLIAAAFASVSNACPCKLTDAVRLSSRADQCSGVSLSQLIVASNAACSSRQHRGRIASQSAVGCNRRSASVLHPLQRAGHGQQVGVEFLSLLGGGAGSVPPVLQTAEVAAVELDANADLLAICRRHHNRHCHCRCCRRDRCRRRRRNDLECQRNCGSDCGYDFCYADEVASYRGVGRYSRRHFPPAWRRCQMIDASTKTIWIFFSTAAAAAAETRAARRPDAANRRRVTRTSGCYSSHNAADCYGYGYGCDCGCDCGCDFGCDWDCQLTPGWSCSRCRGLRCTPGRAVSTGSERAALGQRLQSQHDVPSEAVHPAAGAAVGTRAAKPGPADVQIFAVGHLALAPAFAIVDAELYGVYGEAAELEMVLILDGTASRQRGLLHTSLGTKLDGQIFGSLSNSQSKSGNKIIPVQTASQETWANYAHQPDCDLVYNQPWCIRRQASCDRCATVYTRHPDSPAESNCTWGTGLARKQTPAERRSDWSSEGSKVPDQKRVAARAAAGNDLLIRSKPITSAAKTSAASPTVTVVVVIAAATAAATAAAESIGPSASRVLSKSVGAAAAAAAAATASTAGAGRGNGTGSSRRYVGVTRTSAAIRPAFHSTSDSFGHVAGQVDRLLGVRAEKIRIDSLQLGANLAQGDSAKFLTRILAQRSNSILPAGSLSNSCMSKAHRFTRLAGMSESVAHGFGQDSGRPPPKNASNSSHWLQWANSSLTSPAGTLQSGDRNRRTGTLPRASAALSLSACISDSQASTGLTRPLGMGKFAGLWLGFFGRLARQSLRISSSVLLTVPGGGLYRIQKPRS
uniref:G_PROTEIN_RECEP_F1_2 domain-containing protein n=2 Tax=Macrostomum lignano TaxID=282301 RepID=A0A1I8GZL1_9PLAT